jgi:charged multivesicular body protein 1
MSMKMDNLVTTIKSGNSNTLMMGNFNKIANLLGGSKQPNIENMAQNLETFERAMDEMTVNGKVMDEMMNKNSNADAVADNMMEKLKMEMALEVRYWG